MSKILTSDEVIAITGMVRPSAQTRVLRDLGYIVLGMNGKGDVQALANHPLDPQNDSSDQARRKTKSVSIR